jgi:hypothetical protein
VANEDDNDPEIAAMSAITRAFRGLDDETRRRVLHWTNQKYRQPGGITAGELEAIPILGTASENTTQPSDLFKDLASLFDAAQPETGLDRILVIAYWGQVILRGDDFDAQTVNTELKHLGYPSGNITRDLESLINRTPRLVIQTRKLGTTKQARKQYKLTREGTKRVEEMLSGRRPID